MKFVFYSVIAVLAIVAGVVAFRFSDQAITSSVAPVTVVEEVAIKTVDVLVARVNIPVGSIIDSSMIDRQPWPENLVVEGFVLGDNKSGQDQNIVGKVARSAISAHEPFMKSKLANPNDPGFLAAALPVGMRAVTIATDVVAGVAGFLFPGDRVDILFTHEATPNTAPAGEEQVVTGRPALTEVLGSNIRVLAINVRSANPSEPVAVSPSSVTLEVTDDLAQQIRLAEKNGTLSFSLRSIHDDNPTFPNPTGLVDLSRAPKQPPAMSIVRGPGGSGGKITSINVSSNWLDGEDLSGTGQQNGASVNATPPAIPPVQAGSAVDNNKNNAGQAK